MGTAQAIAAFLLLMLVAVACSTPETTPTATPMTEREASYATWRWTETQEAADAFMETLIVVVPVLTEFRASTRAQITENMAFTVALPQPTGPGAWAVPVQVRTEFEIEEWVARGGWRAEGDIEVRVGGPEVEWEVGSVGLVRREGR